MSLCGRERLSRSGNPRLPTIDMAAVGNPVTLLRQLLPSGLKRNLRTLHRDCYLRASIIEAKRHIRRGDQLPDALLHRIIYGWSNEGWSAKPNLLQALLDESIDENTSILECGTGLSTILLGLIAKQTGCRVLALEHSEAWYELVCRQLSKFGLPSSIVKFAPLKSYGDFDWYDSQSCLSERDTFNLVLCDGPPSNTRGGRYGLLPVASKHFQRGARLIVDDSTRLDEMTMMTRWLNEYAGIRVTSRESTFAILTMV